VADWGDQQRSSEVLASLADQARAHQQATTSRSKSSSFDLERAKLMALMNSISYCSSLEEVAAWNCSRCQQVRARAGVGARHAPRLHGARCAPAARLPPAPRPPLLLQVPGFQTSLAYMDAAWDLVGYMGYLPSLNAKLVAFRGTDSSSFYNW
jgi:hypothetical protein